mmetsp:Transcript_4287/g.5024  ORF Transcript_4287/g.5024 Transcript_4287/m.5024 type:complete len:477 (+) Transcript_4287:409-1839(+)|eukprot:CAMPEP_0204838354 /NCGR_PEP_ID=MMETSP1346-20131115/30635_1 /ASSEMBLY_ACC=CAM_ASM_000771 /TAXON_ID=215587 /ORGANISM="Aplanochytrium stocchinoi, Strain GSBS06" /LENGTH=476 /DNA_ID=CAMNT_0051974337 /DNA_START=380 /DNA_END=1810 /DNA_ORIENTATION=-
MSKEGSKVLVHEEKKTQATCSDSAIAGHPEPPPRLLTLTVPTIICSILAVGLLLCLNIVYSAKSRSFWAVGNTRNMHRNFNNESTKLTTPDPTLNSFTKPPTFRWAVCMLGQARTHGLTYASWETGLLPYLANGGNVDFFIVTSNSTSFSLWKKHMLVRVRPIKMLVIDEFAIHPKYSSNDRGYHVIGNHTDSQGVQHIKRVEIFAGQLMHQIIKENEKLDSYTIQNVYSSLCADVIRHHEVAAGRRYRYIARIRADALILPSIPKWNDLMWGAFDEEKVEQLLSEKQFDNKASMPPPKEWNFYLDRDYDNNISWWQPVELDSMILGTRSLMLEALEGLRYALTHPEYRDEMNTNILARTIVNWKTPHAKLQNYSFSAFVLRLSENRDNHELCLLLDGERQHTWKILKRRFAAVARRASCFFSSRLSEHCNYIQTYGDGNHKVIRNDFLVPRSYDDLVLDNYTLQSGENMSCWSLL